MQQTTPLPATGFVRLPQILAHVPVGKSTWWTWVKSNKAPQPVKLAERVTAWRAEDIHDFIARIGHRSQGGAA